MNGCTGKLPGKRSLKAAPEAWTPQMLRDAGCYWRARIISTAFDLRLFDWLAKAPKTPRAAGKRFGGRAQDWETFLNALVAIELVRRRGSRYENTPFAARHLCSREASFLLSNHDAWDLWGRLPEILTSGKRPKTALPFFTERVKAERLLQALDHDGGKIAPYLSKRLPLRGAGRLLDIGGGLGTFALAFCRRFPKLRATILEHPNVAPLTRSAVKRSRMTGRVEVIGLDLSEDPWPGGFDVIMASNILHAQSAQQNRALIHSAYNSLSPRGHLILRDVLLGADAARTAWGALFSVALLVQTPNGRCYALDEVRRWLKEAGFSKLQGPFASSPLFFDPDSLLIAQKSTRAADLGRSHRRIFIRRHRQSAFENALRRAKLQRTARKH
jgi:SAM-dependent methyltransferase